MNKRGVGLLCCCCCCGGLFVFCLFVSKAGMKDAEVTCRAAKGQLRRSSALDRSGRGLRGLLQVMVVWQDLHQEIQLQRLGLEDTGGGVRQRRMGGGQRAARVTRVTPTCGRSVWTRRRQSAP